MQRLRNDCVNRLDVAALWVESGWRLAQDYRQRLEAELEHIRHFIGADSVYFSNDYLI